MAADDFPRARTAVAMRILGFAPPNPEGMPTRAIAIIRGDAVEVRLVPKIVRRPDPPADPAPRLCGCAWNRHVRRRGGE